MTSPPPPLRFLGAVVGGWAVARAALVGIEAPAPVTPAIPQAAAATPARYVAAGTAKLPPEAMRPAARLAATPAVRRLAAVPPLRLPQEPVPAIAGPAVAPASRATIVLAHAQSEPVWRPSIDTSRAATGRARRWSAYGWSFVRRGEGASLAPGGLLGGSQAGLRLAYRVGGSVAAAARLSAPLGRSRGAEAAVGLDWTVSRRLPVHVLAERRQALGRDARSAFALSLYGGASDARLGRFRLDAWGQAGLVGAHSRDAFAEGAARLSVPLGGALKLGAGAWAAAQPGVARFDAGPSASLRIGAGGRGVTLQADWRFRLAGSARPGSGPALTVATGF